MMTYVTAFIFYTLAMIGIMLVAFVVYKKTFQSNGLDNKGLIKVIDSLHIGNKKHLLLVKIRNENFLIASGVEHTTFLAKLENAEAKKEKIITPEVVKEDILSEIYQENFAQKKDTRFDDFVTPRAQKVQDIQQQFRELYGKEDESEQILNTQMQKKEKVRKLLKELHTNTQGRGNFNG